MNYRLRKTKFSQNKQRRVWTVYVTDVSGDDWLTAPEHALRRFTDPDRALAYAVTLERRHPRWSYSVRAKRH